MPQPAITGVPLNCKFGSLALPNGQGTMTQVNLNDLTRWFWQDYQGDDDYPVLSIGQLAWRGRATVLGRDRRARVLSLPMRYIEGSAGDFGAAKAVLSEAGEQLLTFDTLTAIRANLQAVKNERLVKRYTPFVWDCTLEFLCPTPYWSDITPTAIGATTLNSGTATTFNVTYAGSVFAEPIWTLTIPNTSTATIASFTLTNVTAGQTLTLTFPGNLAASTSWVLTIDSGAFTVRDAGGRSYDVGGSFPNLYGPAGQVNAMSATLTPASGTATNCTISGSVTPRWLL